jgi:hypothetical protein
VKKAKGLLGDSGDGVGILVILSAILGFLIGVGLWLVLRASTTLVEGSQFYGGPLYAAFAAFSVGVIWAVIFSISFTLIWQAFRPRRSPWPLMGYVATATFLVQGCVIVILDAMITGLHLRPWLDANMSDSLVTGIEFTLGTFPGLLTAYLTIRSATRSPA